MLLCVCCMYLDPDVRNIIDKLAVFVARNGVEFEQMTMEKQRDNPKFNFLFGGESHAYYQWRVGQEQASLYAQHSQQSGLLSPVYMHHVTYTELYSILKLLTPFLLYFRDAADSSTNVAAASSSALWCSTLFSGPWLWPTAAAASVSSGAGLLSPLGIQPTTAGGIMGTSYFWIRGPAVTTSYITT